MVARRSPIVVVILQGEGVTVDLVGSIDIKHGVTSSAFDAVPDVPISSFELKLPEGPHSGLAAVLPAKAKGNLCGTSLTMPTTLTGQNGAVVKQTTKIAVTGCAAAKKKAQGEASTARQGRSNPGQPASLTPAARPTPPRSADNIALTRWSARARCRVWHRLW